MGRKEFCNELVNQFNYYSRNEYEVAVCYLILKLLASITVDIKEFNYYADKIKNKVLKEKLIFYYLTREDGL